MFTRSGQPERDKGEPSLGSEGEGRWKRGRTWTCTRQEPPGVGGVERRDSLTKELERPSSGGRKPTERESEPGIVPFTSQRQQNSGRGKAWQPDHAPATDPPEIALRGSPTPSEKGDRAEARARARSESYGSDGLVESRMRENLTSGSEGGRWKHNLSNSW